MKANIEYKGIEFRPNFLSPVTRRICKTQQGYHYDWADGERWCSTLSAGKRAVDQLLSQLGGKLSEVRSSHLEWSARRWPAFEPKIRHELDVRRQVKDALKEVSDGRRAMVYLLRTRYPELEIADPFGKGRVTVNLNGLAKLLGEEES